ncbi:MAG: glutamate 5-kinase [Candidatus Omnitrophica bacterium]|nr:glutamate 5-kinase [Candidatus Omnitrophota bacterium]
MKRTFSRPIKRVVVKLGSSQIADGKMQPRTTHLYSLAKQIKELRKRNVDVVLVSSGAIVLGMGVLKESKRPSDLAELQARAAIGQAALMKLWAEVLKKVGLQCAQVLLTWDDFNNSVRCQNAKHTLNAILKQGVVPIINENDTISTEEIKFGDNDKLSALVSQLIHSDLLVILSDVDAIWDQNKKMLVGEFKEVTPLIKTVSTGTANTQVARGGMKTKIEAVEIATVKIATHAGTPCVITNGSIANVLVKLVDGERIGTCFTEKENKTLNVDSEHEFIRSHFKNS